MNKLLGYFGLSNRARKLVSGEEIVIQAIRSGEAKLVIIASDASMNTKKKIKDKCHTYQVPLVIGFDRDRLGHSVGKAQRVVLAITDQGFAKAIAKQVVITSEVEYIERKRNESKNESL